jgi:anti-sigma factor RsiW
MNGRHCTREELFLFIDGVLSQEERARVEAHCAECASCAVAAGSIERIGRGLRNIPVERASAGFTATVMRELGLARAPRRGFRGLESAGALVAMVVVVGILLTVFYLTGVLREGDVSATQAAAGKVLEQGGELAAGAVSAVGGWLAAYFPFAFGKGALGISLTAAVVLALLALLDRYAGRRWIHRAE